MAIISPSHINVWTLCKECEWPYKLKQDIRVLYFTITKVFQNMYMVKTWTGWVNLPAFEKITLNNTKCYGNESSYTLQIWGHWIRKWHRNFQLSYSFRVAVKVRFFSKYILGLCLQNLSTCYAGGVSLIPRWNHVIGYRCCRCSSRDQKNCCLSTLISSY
jgi:hypothetical protein